MARWEPGAAERLQKSALELFLSKGFEQTTAADIAEFAGLTQRTFFRHFADKRDVLFYGQELFVQAFLSGMDDAPKGAGPMELIRCALASGARLFDNGRRPHSRMRQGVIDAHPALQERERHKLAGLAESLADALRGLGVSDPGATLVAESGVTVFGVAFAQWLHHDDDRPLTAFISQVMAELVSLTTHS